MTLKTARKEGGFRDLYLYVHTKYIQNPLKGSAFTMNPDTIVLRNYVISCNQNHMHHILNSRFRNDSSIKGDLYES